MPEQAEHPAAPAHMEAGGEAHGPRPVPEGIGAQRAEKVETVEQRRGGARESVPHPFHAGHKGDLGNGRFEQGPARRAVHPVRIGRREKMVRPVSEGAQGADGAVHQDAFLRQQGANFRLEIPAPHAEARQRRGLEVPPGVEQGTQAAAQQVAR